MICGLPDKYNNMEPCTREAKYNRQDREYVYYVCDIHNGFAWRVKKG